MSTHEENHPPQRVPINESLIIDTVRIEAERQRREQEERDNNNRERQAAHDRRMLRVTQGLFVATMLTGIAALYQAHISGLSADAARQAVMVAEDARDDADISNGDTLIQMRAQGRTMDKSADAAKRAGDIASRELQLSQRPWVYITEARPTGPLIFDGAGARISFHFKIKNAGHSPALDTFINLELAGPGVPIRERKRFCEQTVKNTEGLGTTLFPDTEDSLDTTLNVHRADLRNHAFHGFLDIWPVACVSYRPSFIDDTQYYTGVIYDLGRRGPPGVGFHVSLRPDQNVPLEELYFAVFPASGTITGVTHNKAEKQ